MSTRTLLDYIQSLASKPNPAGTEQLLSLDGSSLVNINASEGIARSLETLAGEDRINASAVKNIPNVPYESVVLNQADLGIYDVDLAVNYTAGAGSYGYITRVSDSIVRVDLRVSVGETPVGSLQSVSVNKAKLLSVIGALADYQTFLWFGKKDSTSYANGRSALLDFGTFATLSNEAAATDLVGAAMTASFTLVKTP